MGDQADPATTNADRRNDLLLTTVIGHAADSGWPPFDIDLERNPL
jgi:hypothetical protein